MMALAVAGAWGDWLCEGDGQDADISSWQELELVLLLISMTLGLPTRLNVQNSATSWGPFHIQTIEHRNVQWDMITNE